MEEPAALVSYISCVRLCNHRFFFFFLLSFFLLFRVIQVRVQHTKVVNSSTSRTGIEPAEMSYTLYARYAPSQKRRKRE